MIDYFILFLKSIGKLIYFFFELWGYYNDFIWESLILIYTDILAVNIKYLFFFLGVHLFIYSLILLVSLSFFSIPEPEVDITKHVEILIRNFDNPNLLVQTRFHFWFIIFFLILYEILNFVVLYKVACLCLRFDSEHVIVFLCSNNDEI